MYRCLVSVIAKARTVAGTRDVTLMAIDADVRKIPAAFPKTGIQWNLNNPVTNEPVVIGCNKEVAVLQMTSVKQSHPFLSQIAALPSIVLNNIIMIITMLLCIHN